MPTTKEDEDPWIIARDLFVADLDKKERDLFNHATLENLLVSSTEDQAAHQRSSQSRAIFVRLKPFLAAVQDHEGAFNAYFGTYSLALGPIWGSLRVLLQLARQFNKIFDTLVGVLERIGYVLPRLRDYERMFGSHNRIIRALSIAYLDIITLCYEVKLFIRSIQKSRTKSFTALFSPLDHHLTEAVDRFRTHREDVEAEAVACHMIEDAKHYELEKHDRTLASMERKAQLRKHLLHLLSPIDSAEKQRKVLKLRQSGTCEWIFQQSDYQSWKESLSKSLLGIYGIPGCGKTILCSHVVERLQAAATQRTAVIFHYCDYREPRSLDPIIIAGSLVKSLLDSIEITDELATLVKDAYQDGQRIPDEGEMLQILDCVLASHASSDIYVVVDGIDEVDERNRGLLFNFLKYLMRCGPASLKLVISSRDEISSILCPAGQKFYRVHIFETNISEDINTFVRQEMRNLILSKELTIRDASLEDEIIQKLVGGAKGMFLWVTFQLQSLCECDSDADVRRALKTLPRDLSETYERLLAKIKSPERQVLVRRMLQWIVCARRLLNIDEVLESIAFTPSDESWDAAKIPVDPSRLIRASGNLIIIDDEDCTVQLAHYTVQQFLLMPSLNSADFSYQFTRTAAEQYVGETCIVYLCFRDFMTQLSKYSNRTKAHMAVIEKALLGSESIVRGGLIESVVVALSNMLRPAGTYRPSGIDFARHVPSVSHGLQSKYQLLGYIINEWLHHTARLDTGPTVLGEDGSPQPNTADIWQSFQDLVFHKQLIFNLKPWLDMSNSKTDLPHMPLVCWAVRHGHVALLKALEHNTPHSMDQYFRQAARWFGSKNENYLNGETKQIIPTSDIFLPYQKSMANYAGADTLSYYIYQACIRGDKLVMGLYLSAMVGIEDETAARTGKSLSQLIYEYYMIEAAIHGKASICSTLLPHCDFDAYTLYKDRPCNALNWAAYLGNVEVTLLLHRITLARPLDEEHDLRNLWPGIEAQMLIDAAYEGALNIVKTLLSVCRPSMSEADDSRVELSDFCSPIVEERALTQAVIGGHKEIIAYFLEQGVSVNNPLPWRIFDLDRRDSAVSLSVRARIVVMGSFPLHIAIAHQKLELIELLLEGDADPDLCVYYFQKERYVNSKWLSPLAHAASLGNINIANSLLKYGATVESQYLPSDDLENLRYRYTTPLVQAARSGHKGMVKYLLAAGADPDNYDYAGYSPLAAAAAGAHLECARILIQGGADLNRSNEEGKTSLASPAVEAVKSGSTAMLKLLLDSNINLKTTIQRKIPLFVALTRDDVDMAKLLIQYGADPDGEEGVRKTFGWAGSPLCRATRTNQEGMVKLFLECGANIFCAAGWGPSKTTPLETAQDFAHLPAGEIVIRHFKSLREPSVEETISTPLEMCLPCGADTDFGNPGPGAANENNATKLDSEGNLHKDEDVGKTRQNKENEDYQGDEARGDDDRYAEENKNDQHIERALKDYNAIKEENESNESDDFYDLEDLLDNEINKEDEEVDGEEFWRSMINTSGLK